ncbi:MAG: hypothetical protein ACFCD0_10755 [Gemmataceae bacterium]
MGNLFSSHVKKLRLAFDLDETLGVPLIGQDRIIGFVERTGLRELLPRLQDFELCIWTVSNRSYLDTIFLFGLGEFFDETYSWDEKPCLWKDVHEIPVDYLIDDSQYHRDAALEQELADRYIIVPAFGSPEDVSDPLGWVWEIGKVLGRRFDEWARLVT